MPLLEKEAKEKQVAAGGDRGNQHTKKIDLAVEVILPQPANETPQPDPFNKRVESFLDGTFDSQPVKHLSSDGGEVVKEAISTLIAKETKKLLAATRTWQHGARQTKIT